MQKWGIKNPYLLCIGNMRPYKNINILINAFSQLISEGLKDVSLVLAGKASDQDVLEKRNIVSSLSLGDKVIFIRNMNEEDLAALMGGASIYIFPSKNEGFGLPLLEAAATGAPCIASNIEVFRELYGDSVLYFQPDDAFELKDNIIKLLSFDSLKKQIVSKGVANAKRYTWENTAIKTMSTYEKIFSKIRK
jgi:glycosyltransferase involved in cell wall biosynthesis